MTLQRLAWLLALTASGCPASHRLIADVGPSIETPDGGDGSDAPRSCSVSEGPLVMRGNPSNAAGCDASYRCELWAGHGQHLSCPPRGAPATSFEGTCSIWDCLCDDGSGFLADFSTNDATVTRDGLACRYTLELGE
jgi:hypothetical protein